jgi:hypothetical protein
VTKVLRTGAKFVGALLVVYLGVSLAVVVLGMVTWMVTGYDVFRAIHSLFGNP